MRTPFTRPELRFLATGFLGAVGVLGLGLGFWLSPWSPAALDGPARLAAEGRTAEAVDAYAALAHGWGPESTRQDALWHAGLLAAIDLDDPLSARVLYQDYLDRWPDGQRTADVHAQLGVLYAQRLGDALEAARSWERAASLDPDHADAGRWLLQAGRTYARTGQDDLALDALARAAGHPDVAAAAWVAVGRISLVADPARAYEAFDQAMLEAGNAQEERIARLGLVTALERLERRDSALAELDEAIAEGEADDALVRRQRRLRSGR